MVKQFELPEGIEPYDLVNCLRRMGFAVVMFSPEELGSVSSKELEDVLDEHGNVFLDNWRIN